MTSLTSYCYFGSNFGVLEDAETMTIIANLCSICSYFDTIGAALNDDVSDQFCYFGSNFGVHEEAETMTIFANLCSFCSNFDTLEQP